MKCNINNRGRIARLISGIICIIAGVILLFTQHPWYFGSLLIAAGGFQIFEAKSGWCIMRAMGFKTPM
jgi:uncharacterized membrane protein HdeD (DUF308 family)